VTEVVTFILKPAMKANNSTLSLTSAPDVIGWLTPRPDRFTPGKNTQYPLHMRLGEAPGSVLTGAENLVPTASRYYDCAIQASFLCMYIM
jgi:hypothetical protein